MAVTNGLQEILVGDIAIDGDAGTVLTRLGYTNEDSANFSQEDGTTTDFNVEELDEPILSAVKAGKISLAWTLANPDVDALQKLFGGTVSGLGTEESPRVWEAPNKIVPVEKTVKIVPEVGFNSILIPRAQLVAKFNSGIGRNSLFGIEIVATVLKPTKDGVSKLKISE